MKTLIIGLDGASWDFLDSMIEDGKLSNIKELIDNGVSGDLESCTPPITVPAWKVISTGLAPSQLGVLGWQKFYEDTKTFQTVNSSIFSGKDFWEFLDENTGVINLPGTYPAYPIDGFMVSGILAKDMERAVYPEELEETLQDQDYTLDHTPFQNDEDAAFEGVKKQVADRFDLALQKQDDVDVMFVTIQSCDHVQHFMYNRMELEELWQEIDQHIGELVEKTAPRNVFLISDHGFQEVETFFYLNNWLEQEGYLHLDETAGEQILNVDKIRGPLYTVMEKTGLMPIARKILPLSVRNKLPNKDGRIRTSGLQNKIDWKKTRAYKGSTLWVQEDETKQEILESIQNIAHPETGEQIITGYQEVDDTNIHLDAVPGIGLRGKTAENILWDHEPFMEGVHQRYGIFIANGEDIRTGDIEPLHLLDITPTLLHLHGNSIPDNRTGCVATEIFSEDSPATEREIQRTTTITEDIDL